MSEHRATVGTTGPSSDPLAQGQSAVRQVLNRTVFFGSAGVILAVAALAIIFPAGTEAAIGVVVGWISGVFGWYYIVTAAVILIFVIAVGVSRSGRIKLGPEQSRPEFRLFTWAAMLFAAGIGTDLMFYSVSEPAYQFFKPPSGSGGETLDAARQAVVWTLFHYGIIGWAMYALMGMALAYFTYRRNLPLSIRSVLHPLFGDRVWGRLGDLVDIAAVIGTIFGLATSLGIGVAMLNRGLFVLLKIPEGIPAQLGLLLLAVLMATLSVVSGVARGVRRLSELNVALSLALMLFILITGKTTFLLNGLVMNVGDYVSGFVGMTLDTYAFENPQEWMNTWTLFFWAWWIAWAPFVGLFLARISRGRTIRQFVAGTLSIPFIFVLLWVSVFGNSTMDRVLRGGPAGKQFGQQAMDAPERGIYDLLQQFPLAPVTITLAIITGLLFYVTSADSGALVLSNFTSRLHAAGEDGPNWLRIFWACATGLLTLGMLLAGGLTTLQSATMIMGLPFSFVMYLVMFGLYRALQYEGRKIDSLRVALPGSLSGRTTPVDGAQPSWRQRLARVMSYPTKKQALRYLESVGRPAIGEVGAELTERGAAATWSEQQIDEIGLPHVDLVVSWDDHPDFSYRLWPEEHRTPSFASRLPQHDDSYYRIEVCLDEGTQGYDITGYSKEQLINDILDQYERHLQLLHLDSRPLTDGDPVATG
ncbi:choline BCCT transporter BetT [Microlunatus soli]|uniref:Choline/glycine/proline betaine transport protein n=1 Tax=Microlunatus soli TaxID=630515 RepID=A0A1H1P668_9ACTN|nr:choline BCCT transporter BetT [Microlunatus soli]SDS06550.1 choline/glycine/proline betaine transport protein [Microlunatus soli]